LLITNFIEDFSSRVFKSATTFSFYLSKIESAFPEYEVVGISARFGKNMEEFYESVFKLAKKV